MQPRKLAAYDQHEPHSQQHKFGGDPHPGPPGACQYDCRTGKDKHAQAGKEDGELAIVGRFEETGADSLGLVLQRSREPVKKARCSPGEAAAENFCRV